MIISLAAAMVSVIAGKIQKYRMSRLPSKIVYEQDSLRSNPVFYIKDLNYRAAYLEFVKNNESGMREVPLKIPMLYIPGGERIFIRKYLADSILVEFFEPNSTHAFKSMTTGYIHRKYVHDDSLESE